MHSFDSEAKAVKNVSTQPLRRHPWIDVQCINGPMMSKLSQDVCIDNWVGFCLNHSMILQTKYLIMMLCFWSPCLAFQNGNIGERWVQQLQMLAGDRHSWQKTNQHSSPLKQKWQKQRDWSWAKLKEKKRWKKRRWGPGAFPFFFHLWLVLSFSPPVVAQYLFVLWDFMGIWTHVIGHPRPFYKTTDLRSFAQPKSGETVRRKPCVFCEHANYGHVQSLFNLSKQPYLLN